MLLNDLSYNQHKQYFVCLDESHLSTMLGPFCSLKMHCKYIKSACSEISVIAATVYMLCKLLSY